MPEIKCPNCGEVITVDESDYAQLLNQIKNKEFERELEAREEALMARYEAKLEAEIAKKNSQISKLEVENKNLGEKAMADIALVKFEAKNASNAEIESLKKKLAEAQTALELANATKESEVAKAAATIEMKYKDQLSKKDIEKIEAEKLSEQQLSELQHKLAQKDNERTIAEKSLKEKYEIQLQMKEEEVERLKDFKAKQSTKMIGESLEQYCNTKFNEIRTMAYPNAYFEKDNKISETGSKGDFIFKDKQDGQEYISIMFEMKNECDTTATKHKNEDFLKELDKDRNEKGCEYAILVSMLEPESDYYNNGIVDMSYRYPKMYVIRPQYFLTMISILTNAAKNSLQYQIELSEARNANIDITNFEEKLLDFQDKFGKNVAQAKTKFDNAIDEIDKTIQHLTKVRDSLVGTEKYLALADSKAQDITVKKLTRGNKTMKAMFEALDEEAD